MQSVQHEETNDWRSIQQDAECSQHLNEIVSEKGKKWKMKRSGIGRSETKRGDKQDERNENEGPGRTKRDKPKLDLERRQAYVARVGVAEAIMSVRRQRGQHSRGIR
jgi:hypothetical protein